MDSRYASHPPIPDHSRSYAPTSRQPPASSYTSSHRVPLTSIAPLQTLPPLAQHHSQYTYPNSPHAQRGQGTLAPEEQNFAAAGPLYTSNTTTQLPPHTYPSTTRTNQSPTSYTPQSWAQYPPGNTASYPSYNASNVTQLPNLLPMPNGHLNQHNVGVQPSPGFPAGPHYGSHQQQSQYHQSTPEQQHQALPQHRPLAPTHVVGSQGRRGILPSAVGRPAAQPNAAMPGQRSATTPTKDAEGKFPCEHCNKNYLHAKHLKRHMLRREPLVVSYGPLGWAN
ncbi:MAG: hypothetical protein LQ350_005281 [Teloschistes chrysophthalmus]|nr:MAG: hypothetical protein LQ350_005281 [Niorma chrysophthalma]